MNIQQAQWQRTCRPETWVSVVPSLRHAAVADDAQLLRQRPLKWLPLPPGTSVVVASYAASLASDTEATVAYAASYPCRIDQAYVAASCLVASTWEAVLTWDLKDESLLINKLQKLVFVAHIQLSFWRLAHHHLNRICRHSFVAHGPVNLRLEYRPFQISRFQCWTDWAESLAPYPPFPCVPACNVWRDPAPCTTSCGIYDI